MIDPALVAWSVSAAPYFQKTLGADKEAAKKFALHYVRTWQRGLNPRITRVYSDPTHQKQLQAQWDSGNREGLRARPASNSKHILQDFWGRPAARAFDMVTTNDNLAASMAREIGLGAGADFSTPDPGHYFAP